MSAPCDSPTAGQPIPFQPTPIKTLVLDMDGITSISRLWLNGDHRRCRLCPECTATEAAGAAMCLKATDEPVQPERAALYSTFGTESCDGESGSGVSRPDLLRLAR